MEHNQKNFSQYHLLAGGLFAFLAVLSFVKTVRFLSYSFPGTGFLTFVWFLTLVCYAVTAILLFINKRNYLGCVGFGLLAFAMLCRLFIPYLWGKGTLFFAFVAYALTMALALAFFTDAFPQLRNTALKLWFLPAALLLAGALLNGILLLWNYGFVFAVKALFSNILEVAALLLSGIWVVSPDGVPMPSSGFGGVAASVSSGTENTAGIPASNPTISVPVSGRFGIPATAYCGLAKHILLLLFTFGIWYYIWIYKTTENLNALPDEENRNPVANLLLCLFVPFYIVYWVYKSAQRLDKISTRCGIPSDSAVLCLILAIFVSIVPPILMQDKINNILTSGTAVSATSADPSPQTTAAAETSPQNIAARNTPAAAGAHHVSDELKEYKELLDQGIITQEDYDAKKKQLLNL